MTAMFINNYRICKIPRRSHKTDITVYETIFILNIAKYCCNTTNFLENVVLWWPPPSHNLDPDSHIDGANLIGPIQAINIPSISRIYQTPTATGQGVEGVQAAGLIEARNLNKIVKPFERQQIEIPIKLEILRAKRTIPANFRL